MATTEIRGYLFSAVTNIHSVIIITVILLSSQSCSDLAAGKKKSKSVRLVMKQMYLELTDVYTNPYLLKYAIWFSFATGIYFQVGKRVWYPANKWLHQRVVGSERGHGLSGESNDSCGVNKHLGYGKNQHDSSILFFFYIYFFQEVVIRK